MSVHVWWYLSRAAGMVAWFMLTVSVLWGIVLASDLFPRRRRAAWLLGVHRWLAGFTLTFVGLHLLALVADKHSPIGLINLAVPFTGSWRPTAVALGITALWLLVAVQLTALAMKRFSKKWWRGVHVASYWVFWAATLHGALAGTDASRPVYVVTSLVALAAVVFAASYRILTRNLPRRGPAGQRS
jgi:sulfoxide reductase heme-binding subunit YedZ